MTAPEAPARSLPPTRRTWLAGSVGLLAAVGGLAAWWTQSRAAGEADGLGSGFWGRSFLRPEGGELAIQALRGRPLLVNFWATWCPPCIEELPLLDKFYQQNAANGWQVIGLAIDQPSAVRKFLERTPVRFPTALAGLEGTELVKELGNTSGGLPFTLVLGARGQVVARKMGRVSEADLDAWRREQVHG